MFVALEKSRPDSDSAKFAEEQGTFLPKSNSGANDVALDSSWTDHMWKTSTILFAVLFLLALFFPRHSIQTEDRGPCDCGDSVAEAKSMGCEYDRHHGSSLATSPLHGQSSHGRVRQGWRWARRSMAVLGRCQPHQGAESGRGWRPLRHAWQALLDHASLAFNALLLLLAQAAEILDHGRQDRGEIL